MCGPHGPHHPDLALNRIPSSLDNSLLHSIETIIIDWSHQIRDVLSKDSAQALLDGLHPLPRVEFEFWDSRLMNLQCIHEQVGPHSTWQPSPHWPTQALVSSVPPSQGTLLAHSSAWQPSAGLPLLRVGLTAAVLCPSAKQAQGEQDS